MTSFDIPTHATPEPLIAASFSDAALTLPLVSCAVTDVQLRVRARPAETTPRELISDGLYKALALAWYTDPFRQVSNK